MPRAEPNQVSGYLTLIEGSAWRTLCLKDPAGRLRSRLTSICHGLLTATAALGDGGIARRGQFESGTSDRSAAEISMWGGTFNLELNRTTMLACERRDAFGACVSRVNTKGGPTAGSGECRRLGRRVLVIPCWALEDGMAGTRAGTVGHASGPSCTRQIVPVSPPIRPSNAVPGERLTESRAPLPRGGLLVW